MRDKQKHDFAADDMEAELNDQTMQHEQQDAIDVVVWSKIPNTKPAKRPQEDDAKILAMLKRTKLLPPNAELLALQTMLDGADQKSQRAALLEKLQKMPTSRPLQESYRTLAYQLTFADEDAAGATSLYSFHAKQ